MPMDKTLFSHKQQWINDIVAGHTVHGFFLLGTANQQQAKNGPFWRLEIKDATGSLEARIWSPLSLQFADLTAGSIVELQGRADQFKEQLQINVTALRLLTQEERQGLDLAAFLPSSARAPQDMLAEIESLCKDELDYKPWRNFALAVLHDEDIRTKLLAAPAAKSIHHAFVGGLLEHTLGVIRLCLSMADLYPELDRQTLFVGALFHDIGKIWELSGGLANDYTNEGRLVGHINISLERLEPFLRKAKVDTELALHFRHLILSHHGQYEFGSPRLPQTVEAFVLHYADNIDAKLNQCKNLFPDEALADPEQAGMWSAWQNTLNRQVFLPQKTPVAPTQKNRHSDFEPKAKQCSLLSKE